MSLRFIMSAALFCAFIFCISCPAYAQISIAVVDVDTILSESKAAKSIKSQVKKKREGFIDNVKKEEDKLRKEQKAIEAKRDSMSKEELVKKAQEFERGRLNARKSIEEKKSKLDKAYSKSMNSLTKVIFEVCQEIADERKIDLIITRQNIIVGSLSLDITTEVMERMNEKLPKLDLDVE